jgi:hypothetical protein
MLVLPSFEREDDCGGFDATRGHGKWGDTVLILTIACARAGSALEPRLPAQERSALGC